jgi:hypothetical protein
MVDRGEAQKSMFGYAGAVSYISSDQGFRHVLFKPSSALNFVFGGFLLGIDQRLPLAARFRPAHGSGSLFATFAGCARAGSAPDRGIKGSIFKVSASPQDPQFRRDQLRGTGTAADERFVDRPGHDRADERQCSAAVWKRPGAEETGF